LKIPFKAFSSSGVTTLSDLVNIEANLYKKALYSSLWLKFESLKIDGNEKPPLLFVVYTNIDWIAIFPKPKHDEYTLASLLLLESPIN